MYPGGATIQANSEKWNRAVSLNEIPILHDRIIATLTLIS